jgi:hypothetical protein
MEKQHGIRGKNPSRKFSNRREFGTLPHREIAFKVGIDRTPWSRPT